MIIRNGLIVAVEEIFNPIVNTNIGRIYQVKKIIEVLVVRVFPIIEMNRKGIIAERKDKAMK